MFFQMNNMIIYQKYPDRADFSGSYRIDNKLYVHTLNSLGRVRSLVFYCQIKNAIFVFII
jgi:hypothetical protein